MSHLFGELAFRRVQIDTDDLGRADHASALNDVQTNTPETEHDHARAGFDFRRVDHRANAGCDATSDVAGFVKRRVGADFRHGNFGQYRKIGEG